MNIWKLMALSVTLMALTTAGTLSAQTAEIDASRLKPEVLYIDLANPTDARGIALHDEKDKAGLERKELAGMPGAVPASGYVVVKFDPAIVKEETPLLVAFQYFDPEGFAPQVPVIHGILDRPNREGAYTGMGTDAAACTDGWRWWTAFTYANYKTGFLPNVRQASLRLRAQGFRWILALPLDEDTTRQMNDAREKTLAMLADYARLLVAEASLQESRNRLEQGIKYMPADDKRVEALTKVFEEVKSGAWQARIDMNTVIMEVLTVVEPAYLGLFDGQMDGRLKALEAFRQKVVQLAERYRSLSDKAQSCLAEQVKAQCAQYRLKKVALPTPSELGPEHIVKPQDVRDRFFMGLVRQIPLLILPQDSLNSITKEQGIDSTYEYCLTNAVKSLEDGSYDFSALDRLLGEARGLRVELGMHNIPLAGWAEKKFSGGEAKLEGSGVDCAALGFKYGGFRIKAADGRWDGFFMRNGNDNSFTPACFCVWSESLFRYACDFYRAVGQHYRDNPVILRYTLNSEGGAAFVSELGYVWDSALPYYREHLRKKFGNVRKLNAVFGTAYKGFDEIPLPKPVAGEKAVRLTPAWYEYTQMCIERTKYVREEFARVLRGADPNHVIGEVQSSMFGANVFDTYTMAANTPFDTFAASDSDTRSIRYQYSLNRYKPKPIWLYEPYTYNPWLPPEGKGYRVEETCRRMMTANMWRWVLWGHQGLPFFNQRNNSEITDYRIADIMSRPSEALYAYRPVNPVVRPAAGSLAVLKPVYKKLEKVLWFAPVVAPRIGLLESSTTHRVPWPTSGTFADVSLLQGRLEQERKHFFFVPETALVDGTERMDSYRVILVAYATHLRPEARDRLLEWVKKGGVLIGSGPTGLFDPYGRSEGGLPETVFGMKGIEYGAGLTEDSKVAKASGALSGREGISLWTNKDFYWRLPSQGLASGTRVLAALADGTPVAVERDYGKGKVILTATTIGPLSDLYWPMVMTEINRLQPVPEAASSSPDLTWQVRESAAGIRYLSLVNLNISAPTEATITVAGEFVHPRDLTVGEGWAIPAEAGGGVTRFKVWLAPGAGSFIELGKSRTRLTGLSLEEENARLAVGRLSNLRERAAAWGLDTANEEASLKRVAAECQAGRFAEARTRAEEMTKALSARWFEARAGKVRKQADGSGVRPVAATWAESYAAMAQTLLQEGKSEAAEERMGQAEKTLSLTPEVHEAEVGFPFATGRLDLKDLSSWPGDGWQQVYSDQKAKTGELGQFVLVGSREGIYLGARVKADEVTDKAQTSGLPWRVKDGVVLHLRCLDRTRDLPGEFRSEDTYEITFYADGSVFVWDNLLPCDAKLIRNEVRRTVDGYTVAGFIPGEAVRFWPRAGVNVIVDVCFYTYGKSHEAGYWHGKYGQAATWARVWLGEAKEEGGRMKAEGGSVVQLPPNTAQPCLRVEHWMPQETRGVGRAAVSFDTDEALPNGKKGAIVLTNNGQAEEVQLMTQFEPIGKKPGLRVWLKGAGSGAKIELRATGREGSTWQMILKDDLKEWRSVDVDLDKCQQTTEDIHNEVLNKFQIYRPRLNRLIVRFARPLASIKVGLIEYLGKESE